MSDMTRESAHEARTLHENYKAYMSSPFGEQLRAKLASIEQNAVDGAMRGPTPENFNTYFESRGRVSTIHQVRQLFKDIEKNGEDAVKWLQANPPQEDSASETTS